MSSKIKRILRFLRKQFGFGRRLDRERLEQKTDGYQIFLIHARTKGFILYREGDKTLILDNQMSLGNNTTLPFKAFEYWFEPRGEKLSELEYEKAKDRLVKFFSVWGDVALEDSTVRTVNQIIADLNARGIDFHKLEDTYYGNNS